MNINEAFEFLNFIANKNQSGTVTPTQFNQIASRAQWEFFEKEYLKWQQTQDVTDALAIFIKTLPTSVSSTGQLLYPTDYEHSISTRHYFVKNNNQGIEVPVEEIDNDKYGDYLQSEIVTPTLRYPIYTAYSNYLQFAPKNIGLVTFDYFRKPTTPIWDYDLVNNRPLFVANGGIITTNTQLNGQTLAVPRLSQSTDWELPDQVHNQLIFMMGNYLGMNLREDQLIQYSELQKQEQK